MAHYHIDPMGSLESFERKVGVAELQNHHSTCLAKGQMSLANKSTKKRREIQDRKI